MHGNVHLLVCVECGGTLPITAALARQLRAQQPVPCQQCSHEALRFKVMMYEDAESERALCPSLQALA
jgi:NAD-dependent SIR2 family protein deacetylase